MGRIFRKGFDRSLKNDNDSRRKTDWNSIREVRLIDSNGDMVGIVPTRKALQMAEDAGLTLINISPNAVPPVCKICDYGKYKFDQQKKQKNNKSTAKQKEIQFTINIGENDLNIKLRKVIEFLREKNTVLLIMQLKGRDMPRIDTAMELMRSICSRLSEYAKQIDEPRLTGRKIVSVCK